VQVPAGRRLFWNLTVAENLRVGGWIRHKEPEIGLEMREFAFELFPPLRDALRRAAGELPPAEEVMLAVARGPDGCATFASVGQPSARISGEDARGIFTGVRRIAMEGIAALIANQAVKALDLVDRVFMMEGGRVTFTGSPVVVEARFGNVQSTVQRPGGGIW
jgi:branched-chain amino acid transport system ATP-binding protein